MMGYVTFQIYSILHDVIPHTYRMKSLKKNLYEWLWSKACNNRRWCNTVLVKLKQMSNKTFSALLYLSHLFPPFSSFPSFSSPILAFSLTSLISFSCSLPLAFSVIVFLALSVTLSYCVSLALFTDLSV